jgi:hypothetical protein
MAGGWAEKGSFGPRDDTNGGVRADEDLTNFMGNAVGCMGVTVGPGSQNNSKYLKITRIEGSRTTRRLPGKQRLGD